MSTYDWTQLAPTHVPTRRTGHGLAYDETHGSIVLFGGLDGTNYLGDTWLWNGSDWIVQAPAHSPSARRDFGFCYDAATGLTVLYGGYNRTDDIIDLTDTWTWDGSDWTQQAPATNPGNRTGSAMVYDRGVGNTVLFGGLSNSLIAGVYRNDTWTWDGVNWTQELPAASPPARNRHGIGYDWNNGRPIIFGGYNGAMLADMWAWVAGNWVNVGATPPPSARQPSKQMAEGPAGVITFGGENLVTLFHDTYLYDGLVSFQLLPGTSPPNTAQGAMAGPPDHSYVLLFGGKNQVATPYSSATWLFHLSRQTYEVALGYGGVVPGGGADRAGPFYLQSALPALDLSPGCTVSLRAEDSSGALRTLDTWTDVRLWVDDGS